MQVYVWNFKLACSSVYLSEAALLLQSCCLDSGDSACFFCLRSENQDEHTLPQLRTVVVVNPWPCFVCREMLFSLVIIGVTVTGATLTHLHMDAAKCTQYEATEAKSSR